MSRFCCLPNKPETKKHLPKARLTLTFLCLLSMQGPHLLLLLEEVLQLLDLLIIVLPLGNDSHSSLQFGFFSHGIITLKTQGTHLSELKKRHAVQNAKGSPMGMGETEEEDQDFRVSPDYTVRNSQSQREQRSQAQMCNGGQAVTQQKMVCPLCGDLASCGKQRTRLKQPRPALQLQAQLRELA